MNIKFSRSISILILEARKHRHGEVKWFGGNKSEILKQRSFLCCVCVAGRGQDRAGDYFCL